MNHVTLMGDSSIDNMHYVGKGGLPVIEHLRDILRPRRKWSATMVAMDGAVISSIPGQLARVPEGTTHVVVSVGGNDALGQIHVLGRKVRDVATAFYAMSAVQDQFLEEYEEMCDDLQSLCLPLLLCTIYEPCHAPNMRVTQAIQSCALSLFDDVIHRVAMRRGIPLLDLRLVMTEARFYDNPIEPNDLGGRMIARAISDRMEASGFHATHRTSNE